MATFNNEGTVLPCAWSPGRFIRVLIVLTTALSVLTPRAADAQVVIWQVPCSTLPLPAAGPYFIDEYQHIWAFDLWFTWGGGTTSGRYNGRPDPAQSDVWNNTYLRWTTPGFIADCFRTRVTLPTGGTIEDMIYVAISLTGYRDRIGSGEGGGGDCDYMFREDPTVSCGGGGGGGGSGDSPPGPAGDPPLDGDPTGGDVCTEFQLDPGCYDVYVDDVYDSTICCP